MLESLGLHDTAINQKGYVVGYSDKGDLIMWLHTDEKPCKNKGDLFSVNYNYIKDDLWTLNYCIVSFIEAFEAHHTLEKDIVYFHNEEMQYRIIYGDPDNFLKLSNDSIELREIINGRWIIVN